MPIEPQKEHAWLQQLVGDWTFESEALMGPGQPPVKVSGTHTATSIGGVWIIGEGTADMQGECMITVMTLGYDPPRGRFVGTFIGSMMTAMWIYDGALDAAGRVLTLDTVGPSFSDPNKTAKYQDFIEVHSVDHHTLSSRVQAEDGSWIDFQTAHYRRKL